MYKAMPSMRDAYSDYFLIGAAVSPEDLQLHADLLKKHFSSITAENCMKYEPIHPSQDVWHFEAADNFVRFGIENGIAVRAHAPVWHSQVGRWMFADGSDGKICRELLLERLENHMMVFGSRYGEKIYAWDVVNEAVADSGEEVLRNSEWKRVIGDDFMVCAFQIAKQCVPDHVKLFYNDYNAFFPKKHEKIMKVLRYLKENGAPIDGMGMQQHVNPSMNLDDIKRAIENYASLDLCLHVTELDVSLFPTRNLGNESITDRMLQKQYDFYVRLFEIYRSYADVIDSVTTWGVCDNYTWLDGFPVPGRKNYPLLFHYDHEPKNYTRRIVADARLI